WWCRGDEYYAGFSNRTNARNRSTQGNRRAQAGHLTAIHAGGHHLDSDGRGAGSIAGSDHHLDNSRNLELATSAHLYLLGYFRLRCSGRRRTTVRHLSRVESCEPGSDRIVAIRVGSFV